MRKSLVFGLTLTVLVASVGTASAVTWQKVGDLGFSVSPGNLPGMFDRSRIKFNAITRDPNGNIYATCVNGNNDGVAGGLSIFPASGPRIDIDLNALGFPGGITKMVVGGDGNVYALQNWREINWPYNKGVNRVLKITGAGAVSEIWNAGPASDANQIQGMDVDDQGRIFWNMNGADGYWKYHFLQMYDPANPGAGVQDVRANVNNGWSDQDRMVSLEYTKNGWFSVINSGGNNWSQDPISETANRSVGLGSNPGWGRTHCTLTEYDPVHDVLWTGALGSTDGSDACILSRWTGINPATGVASGQNVWHAVDNAADMGQKWWISGLAVDVKGTGDAWMGIGVGDATSTIAGWRGKVFRRTLGLALVDEGMPQANSDVVALAYFNGRPWVTVMDRTTGVYSLYVPEPATLFVLGLGALPLLRRRRPA